ncbi:MAG: hypothetical protein ACFFD8_07270 [Candidatus Thorarchaeota archaeon]
MSQTSKTRLQLQLQRLEFVTLPKGIDGTTFAYRHYSAHGAFCCDFLVIRELNEKSGALRNEAALLIHYLNEIQTQINTTPHHIFPCLQSHVISFLGKKAYLITHESGQLAKVRIFPLLINWLNQTQPTDFKHTSVHPSHLVDYTELEQYVTEYFPKLDLIQNSPEATIRPLKRSYRYLGLAIFLLPFLIGLSGICWALGLSLITASLLLTSFVVPIVLLKKAQTTFNQFHVLTSIAVIVPQPLPLQFPIIASPTHITQSNHTNPHESPSQPIASQNASQLALSTSFNEGQKNNPQLVGSLPNQHEPEKKWRR